LSTTREKFAPGRKRSEATRVAILEAAHLLLVEKGYQAVTTAQIAAAARAGKQTIYRWWPSKAALALDALQHLGASEIDPIQATDTSLEDFFRRVCQAATLVAPVLRSLMAEAQFDAALHRELKDRLIERRRQALRSELTRWGVTDEHRREALVLAIYGAFWYRLLMEEPLDEEFVGAMAGLASA
jgi:AcrR family transcriptional regulator